MLKGIVVRPLTRFYDERGHFSEMMRADWEDVFDDKVMQANHSFTFPGIVRAWHRHQRGQVDWFIPLKGTLQICAYDDATMELDEILVTGESLRIVKIPGHYWHGFRVVGNEPGLLVYFVNRLYDHKSPDEERRPWDDRAVAPVSINGDEEDPRCGKPWDWFHPPHQ